MKSQLCFFLKNLLLLNLIFWLFVIMEMAAFELDVFNYELCSNELYIFREDKFYTCMPQSQTWKAFKVQKLGKHLRYNLS